MRKLTAFSIAVGAAGMAAVLTLFTGGRAVPYTGVHAAIGTPAPPQPVVVPFQVQQPLMLPAGFPVITLPASGQQSGPVGPQLSH